MSERTNIEIKKYWMKKCIALAKLSETEKNIDPLMAILIVHNNELVFECFSKNLSEDLIFKAIETIKNQKNLSEITIYMNITPIFLKNKKMGINLLIDYKVPEVVIATLNPYEKGEQVIRQLKEAGIEVSLGVLEKEAKFLNRKYFTYHKYKKPYISLYVFHNSEKPINQDVFLIFKKENYIKEHAILLEAKDVIKENSQFIYSSEENETPIRLVSDFDSFIPAYFYVLSDDFKTFIFRKKYSRINKNTNKRYIQSHWESKEECLEFILSRSYKNRISSLIIESDSYFFDICLEKNLWNEIHFIQSKHDKKIEKKLTLNHVSENFYTKKENIETIILSYYNNSRTFNIKSLNKQKSKKR